MEKIKSIATEEQVEELAKKVLDKVIEKTKDELGDKFYRELSLYLYKHHSNYENKIFEEVFRFICGEKWSKFKDKYDAEKLRAKIYLAHKEEINKQITEQVVEEEIKKYFGLFLADEHKTGWKYHNLEKKISEWIYENLHTPQMKKIAKEKIVIENKNLEEENKRLNDRLKQIEELSN